MHVCIDTMKLWDIAKELIILVEWLIIISFHFPHCIDLPIIDQVSIQYCYNYILSIKAICYYH